MGTDRQEAQITEKEVVTAKLIENNTLSDERALQDSPHTDWISKNRRFSKEENDRKTAEFFTKVESSLDIYDASVKQKKGDYTPKSQCTILSEREEKGNVKHFEFGNKLTALENIKVVNNEEGNIVEDNPMIPSDEVSESRPYNSERDPSGFMASRGDEVDQLGEDSQDTDHENNDEIPHETRGDPIDFQASKNSQQEMRSDEDEFIKRLGTNKSNEKENTQQITGCVSRNQSEKKHNYAINEKIGEEEGNQKNIKIKEDIDNKEKHMSSPFYPKNYQLNSGNICQEYEMNGTDGIDQGYTACLTTDNNVASKFRSNRSNNLI